MINRKLVDSRLMIALNHIEENLNNNALCLENISRSAGLSSWHFSRLFKAQMGTGCREYLTSVRVKRAAILLTTTALSIKEIADKLGYNHVSKFDRHFKKKYGMSPRTFRFGAMPSRNDQTEGSQRAS